jgi:hypothetical protein
MTLMKTTRMMVTAAAVAVMVLVLSLPGALRAEVLNDDEFGSLEIIDISVIEELTGVYTPVGLDFNLTRGSTYYPGDDLMIRFMGQHEMYVTIIDYSPDRTVKPLVVNEHTTLTDGGLHRETWWTIGSSLGKEYILMIVSRLPLTDARIETIALAPNEVELDETILKMAVNDFRVVASGRDPGVIVDMYSNSGHGNMNLLSIEDLGGTRLSEWDGVTRIPLSDFGYVMNYPMNTYPYNPWSYMYLYPYPKLVPTAYIDRYGFFSNIYYVIPSGPEIRTNLFDYANLGWLDDGIWIIPPGGSFEGKFRVGEYYSDYYFRVLPHLIQQNTSYQRLHVEINGYRLEPNIDFSGAIGFGGYYTYDPFAYYNAWPYMRPGQNTVRLYWPEDEEENFEIQMMDIIPIDVIENEFQEAQADEALVDADEIEE